MNVDRRDTGLKQKFFDSAAGGWGMEFDRRDRSLLDSMMKTFIESLPEGKAGPVIDIGCGTGVLFPYFSKNPFCGVDISYSMLARAIEMNDQRGLGLCQADAHTLPFKESSAAGIVGFAVLPHLSVQELFIQECRRVLMSAGILFIIHLRTAAEINKFHRTIGGAIGNDHLPDAPVFTKMLINYGFSIEINDIHEKYLIAARKL